MSHNMDIWKLLSSCYDVVQLVVTLSPMEVHVLAFMYINYVILYYMEYAAIYKACHDIHV